VEVDRADLHRPTLSLKRQWAPVGPQPRPRIENGGTDTTDEKPEVLKRPLSGQRPARHRATASSSWSHLERRDGEPCKPPRRLVMSFEPLPIDLWPCDYCPPGPCEGRRGSVLCIGRSLTLETETHSPTDTRELLDFHRVECMEACICPCPCLRNARMACATSHHRHGDRHARHHTCARAP
jgi:hypothetical protein